MSKRNPIRIQQGYTPASAVPTQVVSNEEFIPPAQTAKQAQVEWLIHRTSEQLSSTLGINRREFLKTTGGMALAFLAMNQVFGKFFDVLNVEAAEPQAVQALKQPCCKSSHRTILRLLAPAMENRLSGDNTHAFWH